MATSVSKRDYDRLNIDELLRSLFAVSDSSLINESFDGIVESGSTDSHQDDFIQRALRVGSVITEAGKRFARKRSTVHNTSVWPLPADLTIKVFSMLDTRSACTAAATCLFFQKCAIDPLCYTNIDLTSLSPKINEPKINNDVASTMIERAGKTIQSIKLGAPSRFGNERDRLRKMLRVLTGSCLSSLSANGGALGSHLRILHLYNIEMEDEKALSAFLSVCPSLVEIKIEYMNISISRILESVSRNCRLLERFYFEFSGGPVDLVETSVCKEFVVNCPKITTLALDGCELPDSVAFKMVKGFHELKHVDFTSCFSLTGSFLENLGTKDGGNSLEVLILRQCHCLNIVEVKKFMTALLEGKFRHLKHLDISNELGLDTNGNYNVRCYDVSFIPIKELLKQRPNFCLVAKIPKYR